MFGSFLYGTLGRLCQIGAVVVLFVLIINRVPAAAVVVVVGGLAVFGTYLIYLSRHTVRIRR